MMFENLIHFYQGIFIALLLVSVAQQNEGSVRQLCMADIFDSLFCTHIYPWELKLFYSTPIGSYCTRLSHHAQ